MAIRKELLEKIIALDKRGEGGEKTNAIRMLKRICERNELDFDEVMNRGENLKEYEYKYRGKISQRLVLQIFFSITGIKECQNNKYCIFYKSTPQQHAEFEVAVTEYAKAYKKEQKALRDRHKAEKNSLFRAFINRHDIFPEEKEPRKEKKLTTEELEEIRISMRVGSEMSEEVQLNKRLT